VEVDAEYGQMERTTQRQRSVTEYWLMFRRHNWIFVCTFLITCLGAFIWVLSLPNIYKASIVILVESQQVPDSFVRSTVSTPVQERLRTLTQQIKSKNRLENVIKDLRLVEEIKDRKFMDIYIDKMIKNIEIETKNNYSFMVSYYGKDPNVVMKVTNKLAFLFIEENLKVREQHVIGTTKFLADELQRVRALLESQEKVITEYKQRHLGELPGHQEANQRALDRLQSQLQATLDALDSTRNRKSLLSQQLTVLSPTTLTRAEPNMGTNALEQQIIRRLEVLTELQGAFTDEYPDVIRLKQEIATLRKQLAAQQVQAPAPEQSQQQMEALPGSLRWRIQEDINQAELQIQNLQREQTNIRKRIGEYEQKIANAAEREQELMILTRGYESTRQEYDSLSERHKRAEMAENLEKRQKAEQFKVLDPARLPTKPWKPNRAKLLMMGLGLGLVAGVGLVLLAEYHDQSFHDPIELEQQLMLPVLATIPVIVTASNKKMARIRKGLLCVVCVIFSVLAVSVFHLFLMKIDVLTNRIWEFLEF
jgi:polysaccharide chain length determinant protein (PEP-CTERM system associated)